MSKSAGVRPIGPAARRQVFSPPRMSATSSSHHRRFSKLYQNTSEYNMLSIAYKNSHPSRPLLHQLFFICYLCYLFLTSWPYPPFPFLWNPLPPTSSQPPSDLPHLKDVEAIYQSLPFIMCTFPNCALGRATHINFILNTFFRDAGPVASRKREACESTFQVRVIKFTFSSFVYLYRSGTSCLTG